MSEQKFADQFNVFSQERHLIEGSDLLAEVCDINENYVIVNAGLKSEARIPLEEFYNDSGNLEVAVGDRVEVEIEMLENGLGETVLSRRNTRRKQAWRKVMDAMENEGAVEGLVTNRVKGGYSVMMDGLRGFLPGSLVDIFPLPDPMSLVGERIEFRPIKVNMVRSSIVVSRRAVIERTMLEVKDSNVMSTLEPGAKLPGVVRAVVEYGAFVEVMPGVYGLLHITDISWKHTASVAEVLKKGDEIEVVVLKVDEEKGRVSLGMKQLQPDPWEFFDRSHPINSRAFGKVTRVLEYGIFVEVDNGVQGLVHNSEMSWTRKTPNPAKIYNIGDEVEVMILDIDAGRRRISLGVKQCQPNPWQEFAVAYRKGDKVSGKVRSVNEFGLFVELSGGIDGLVRMSELSYEKNGDEAARDYVKGQEVEMVVTSIDAERERISLSIKQINDGDFDAFVEQNSHGSLVQGTVSAVLEKGAQVRLEGGVRAFLPIGEIADKRIEQVSDYVKEGDELEFVLIDHDIRHRQVTVSLKEKDRSREKTEKRPPIKPSANTLGALLQAKILETKADKEAKESAAAKAKASDSAAADDSESSPPDQEAEETAAPAATAADDGGTVEASDSTPADDGESSPPDQEAEETAEPAATAADDGGTVEASDSTPADDGESSPPDQEAEETAASAAAAQDSEDAAEASDSTPAETAADDGESSPPDQEAEETAASAAAAQDSEDAAEAGDSTAAETAADDPRRPTAKTKRNSHAKASAN